MNRWFPRHAREAILGVAAAASALGAAGCTPNQSVQPGAPKLTEVRIVQAGAMGPSSTSITGSTPDCAAGVTDGSACNPVVDGGTPDTICRQVSASNWCTCTADMMDPTTGTWGCPTFGPIVAVIAIFDRLISTAPFDDGGANSTAMLSTSAGAAAATVDVDYSSNGSATGLVIPLFSQYFFGNYRFGGPSLFMTGDPAYPSGTAVTISLSKDSITAKDGHTPFTGDGFLMDGIVTFTTTAFTATLAAPPGVDGGADVAPDMTPATLTFTNFVQAMPDASELAKHITVTAGAANTPVAVDVASMDGLTFTITPVKNTTWPASSTITITVAGNAQDVLGEKLPAAVTATFTTGAS
jgi:hypothetical protein